MDNENEVVSVLRQQKQTGGRSKFYKQESDAHRGEVLAEDIGRKVSALRDTIRKDRVAWDNLEDVQQRCMRYLLECQSAQALPSVGGLAVFALGVSRQSLNGYMRTHPQTETTQFLQQMKDVFADTLETAALTNNINTIMAIFVLKNDHDRADRVEIGAVTPTPPLGEQLDEKALTERLDALPDADY